MSEISHTGRLSLATRERTYVLGTETLDWRDDRASGTVPLADITAVDLISYAGVGGQHRQCTLHTRDARKLKFRSHHFAGIGMFEDRTETFTLFVRNLCDQVAVLNPEANFRWGSGSLRVAWALVLVICATGAAILLFGLTSNELPTLTALSILVPFAFLTLFAWRNFVNNKPLVFDPRDPPPGLLGD